MRQLHNCFRLIIFLCLHFSFQSKAYSQNEDIRNTNILDSLIAVKAYEKADSALNKNINRLKEKLYYQDLTKRIYYFGKIALQKHDKPVAIKKVNDFANSITDLTDSLEVSRQKHLVLARFYVYLRDYKNASEQNLLALEDTKKMPDATGDLFGLIHHNLSIDFRRLGNLKKAIWHSKESIRQYLSYPKSDKTKVLDAYNSLGGRMWDSYKIDSALYYFKKGEKIIDELESTPMNTFYHRAKTQSNISSVYVQLGNIDEAMAYNEKAIKNYNAFINSEAEGKDFFKEEARLFLFLTIENYAEDFIALGNYTKARNLNEYVYQQKIKHMPENDSEIGYSALNLGNIYLKLKDHELAETFFNKGLELYSKNSQDNQLGIADAYYYKGIINEYNGNIDQAKTYYELSKEGYESVFEGNFDNFYLNAMLKYSNFYSKNGYDEKAIEMAQKAYDYVLQNQGKTTTAESSQLVNLANIYFNSKQYDKAFSSIKKALVLFENTDGRFSNKLNSSLEKPMALLLQSKIVLELQDRNDSIVLKKQFENLNNAISILELQKTALTSDENLSVIIEDNDEVFEYAKLVSLWLYQSTKNKTYLKDILSLHESKLYNRIRQQLNVRSDFTSSELTESTLEKEQNLQKKLREALNDKNNIEAFIEANKNWQNFLNKLKTDNPKYFNLKYASIATSFEMHNNINENNSVIRYVYIYDKLFAFLIEKDIKLFELDSKEIDKTLNGIQGENEIFQKNTNTYHDLYKLLWQPIERSISKTNIIIVPDENLFNLSFEVLATQPLDSFKELHKVSLINTYSISYNYSLLLINNNKTPKFFESNFVAFSPEFTNEMKNDYKIAIKDSVFLDKSYLTLLPQPFATDLANEYSKIFNGTSFVNDNASKQIFTNYAKEHKIIHIGTHAESNNVSPELSRLIFAKNVNDTIATDDNSLYTYEIYNQNLSSNLAILTACETGRPSYQSGEGMISLAHAFNYAGSESMLTSLWKIDEQSSTKIIENFYDYIKQGHPKDKALQNAKLDYLATAEGRTLAPQYWAGLVLIGDTTPIDLKTSSNLVFWMLGFIILLLLVIIQIKRRRKA
ncbi:CHAT domain-containing protein [Psychroserpens sp.]|uniref:CHAT domain-containing protein n=1 Tax=Psychroserpens sp. TaxID=2020870 RepID=UPI00385E7967